MGWLLPGRARGASDGDGAAPNDRGVLAPPQNPGQARPVTLDEFVVLSERLTGHRPLDRNTARHFLDALLELPAERALLTDLVHGTPAGSGMTPAHAAVERRIVESWYTGEHEVNGTTRVAAYTGALMWKVLGPAPGSCAGETGYWSRAPEAKA